MFCVFFEKPGALLLTALIGLFAAGSAIAQAPQSASFEMTRVSVGPSGGLASSTSFDTRVSIEAISGGMASVCGATWVQTSGFLSVLTSGPVPVQLSVSISSANPLEIDLDWTGTDNAFEVRRAFTPATITDPGSLFSTLQTCSTTDTDPEANEILFYRVVPISTAGGTTAGTTGGN